MLSAPKPEKARPASALRSGALQGTVAAPGDKSISQRALILGAMAEGESMISGLLESGDVLSTAGALKALGAGLTRDGEGLWRVKGVGLGGWQEPRHALDFGNSGTGSRLMMGAVATTPLTAVFTGDASLRARPMARVLDPLTRFGLSYEGQGAGALMPVTVRGAGQAKAISCEVQVASAQVKSALLLGALNAEGESRITQRVATRDHTEKLLKIFGSQIAVVEGEEGETIHLTGLKPLEACRIEVPGDPSSAAFPLVAALIVPGSEIVLPGILLNSRRTGLLQTVMEMGGDIAVVNRRESGGEEIGDLTVRHSRLKGVRVPAARAASMIDEYPILAVAAAFAQGDTFMEGLEELRVKESDRLAAIAKGLAENGVGARETEDGLVVHGTWGRVPGGGLVSTGMDHRIAMAFLTMGFAADAPVTVDDVSMIATSFPTYRPLMRALGAEFAGPP
ncbi:MAG: 3-phosphoshikimate 1-carboxyvinyltransferase [Rhizomicrobium sp.]